MRNPNGTFAPGNPGKPKGAKDRRSTARAKVARVVTDYLTGPGLQADLQELTAKERITAVTRLLPFVLAHARHEDGGLTHQEIVQKLLEFA